MGRCCQLVMGPAGVGKSSYCKLLQDHCAAQRRTVHVINLDPAAESFAYEPELDVRELVTVDDVMEEMELGPNGALVYCMEYLLDNMDWLEDELRQFADDDYLILDCPGQIELYSHIPVMQNIVRFIKGLGYAVCGVYLIDAHFMVDPTKFISGTLLCLSTMVSLEIPQVNVISKADLVDKEELDRILDMPSATMIAGMGPRSSNTRLRALTNTIASVVDDYTMVQFVPLDPNDEDTIDNVLTQVDLAIQYGEDLEPKEPKDEWGDDDGGEKDGAV